MSQFVLIHGASHGGWCWHKVKKLLEEGAHTVQAPDLPGHEPQTILPISAPLRRSPGRSVRRIGVVCQRDRALTPDLPVALVAEIFVLNSLVWLPAAFYLRKAGFLAAVEIHFWADLVWHVLWGLAGT